MAIPLLNPYYEIFKTLSGGEKQHLLNLRKKLIWAYSWAIPSDSAICKLIAYSPFLELGAGTGYWAWLLEQAGARVLAYDSYAEQPPHWHRIEKGGPEVLSQFSTHTLLLCWPPFESSMAFQALQNYSGQTVIYVGEWEGRTADLAFHSALKSREWRLVDELKIPNWPGYSDQIYVFERNPKTT
jgi:hypothetical protein